MAGRQLLTEVSKLTELRSVRVAIKESFKGAAIVGVSALIGSLMFGPRGLALGGALGGLSAAAMADTYKSIPEILLDELTEQQQDELVALIYAAVKSIPIHEAADFAIRMSQDQAVAATVAMTVISYLNSLPGMEIQD